MRTKYFSELVRCLDGIQTSAHDGAQIPLSEGIRRCRVSLQRAKAGGGVAHVFGNGGSASIAAHAQNDLEKRAGIRSLVHQDVPMLTACANDDGYASSYKQPLALWLRYADIVFAISSSGMSKNITSVAKLARQRNVSVVTFSGFIPDNDLRGLGHLNFYVPSSTYGHVELTHAALLHYITDTAMEDGALHIAPSVRRRRSA